MGFPRLLEPTVCPGWNSCAEAAFGCLGPLLPGLLLNGGSALNYNANGWAELARGLAQVAGSTVCPGYNSCTGPAFGCLGPLLPKLLLSGGSALNFNAYLGCWGPLFDRAGTLALELPLIAWAPSCQSSPSAVKVLLMPLIAWAPSCQSSPSAVKVLLIIMRMVQP
ncbi:unnamed protein product [Prunus armeniaca]